MWETEATKPADLTAPHRFPSMAGKKTCVEISDSKDGVGTKEGQEKKMEDTFLA